MRNKYTMRSQDIIKALKSDGWEQVAQKGQPYLQFKHPIKTWPRHCSRIRRETIPIGDVQEHRKQANLKLK